MASNVGDLNMMYGMEYSPCYAVYNKLSSTTNEKAILALYTRMLYTIHEHTIEYKNRALNLHIIW